MWSWNTCSNLSTFFSAIRAIENITKTTCSAILSKLLSNLWFTANKQQYHHSKLHNHILTKKVHWPLLSFYYFLQSVFLPFYASNLAYLCFRKICFLLFDMFYKNNYITYCFCFYVYWKGNQQTSGQNQMYERSG